MISSEPIAWNVLVEDQCEERQEQAKTAEQAIVTKESMSAIDVADARGNSLAITAVKASSDFGGLRARSVKNQRGKSNDWAPKFLLEHDEHAADGVFIYVANRLNHNLRYR